MPVGDLTEARDEFTLQLLTDLGEVLGVRHVPVVRPAQLDVDAPQPHVVRHHEEQQDGLHGQENVLHHAPLRDTCRDGDGHTGHTHQRVQRLRGQGVGHASTEIPTWL